MRFQRGKIADVITGPRWRVKHHAKGILAHGLFDIVGGKDEEEAKEAVRRAYARERVMVSVERMD